ncbi:MAG: T9SS type A sorting domain-containing protein [Arcticibacter sp.]
MKRGKLLLTTLCMLIAIASKAQTVSWAYGVGNTGSDQGYDISHDALGNVYVTGWFSGSIQFGNQTLVSFGLQDIFLASYDNSGNLNWVQQAGSVANDVGAGIATAPNGDTYITGWFKDTCDFSGSTVVSNGNYDMFIAKYNAAGAIQWVGSGGGAIDDYGNRVAFTSDGGDTIAGSFKSTFSASGMQMTSNGNRDILVCHYSANGQLEWMKGIGGSSEDRAYGIEQDGNGDYYITGVFGDVVDFDGTVLTCNSLFATYLAKLSAQGNVIWALKGDAFANDFARGFGVKVDPQGNVVTNGFFSGTLIMGGATLLASGGQYDQDSYLIKFSPSGSLLWARHAGGSSTDQATDLHITSSNEILEVGFLHDLATFNNTTVNAAGQADCFVSKYDAAGNLLSVSTFGGAGNEYGYGISADDNGSIYITGVFTGACQMGPYSLTSNGGNDILIAKVSLSPLGLSDNNELASFSLFPNPAQHWLQVDCSALKQQYQTVHLEMLDLNGKMVYSDQNISYRTSIYVADLPSGLYLLRLHGNGFSSTTRLMVD